MVYDNLVFKRLTVDPHVSNNLNDTYIYIFIFTVRFRALPKTIMADAALGCEFYECVFFFFVFFSAYSWSKFLTYYNTLLSLCTHMTNGHECVVCVSVLFCFVAAVLFR